jgi:hypothetical protein
MRTTEFQEPMIDNINIIIDQIDVLAGLSTAQLNWKEDPGKWSILECVEHLNRYNSYYIQEIENNFTSSKQSVDAELISTWIGQKSIAMMQPKNRKKQKTFKKMNPANSALNSEIFQKLFLDQQRIKNLLQGILNVDANAKVVRVEFFKLLKMTIAEGLEFLIVHQQRHMIQALDIKAKIFATQQVGSLVV